MDTFSDGKVSVKVRTGLEKMWYNMFGEKNGKDAKLRKILLLRKGKKSFLVVKRGEILSVLLTVFCKAFKNERGKSETWKINSHM